MDPAILTKGAVFRESRQTCRVGNDRPSGPASLFLLCGSNPENVGKMGGFSRKPRCRTTLTDGRLSHFC